MQGLFCLEGCHDSAGCCIGRQEHLGGQAGLPVEAQRGDIVGLCSAALGAEGAHIDLSALQTSVHRSPGKHYNLLKVVMLWCRKLGSCLHSPDPDTRANFTMHLS